MIDPERALDALLAPPEIILKDGQPHSVRVHQTTIPLAEFGRLVGNVAAWQQQVQREQEALDAARRTILVLRQSLAEEQACLLSVRRKQEPLRAAARVVLAALRWELLDTAERAAVTDLRATMQATETT